MSKPDLENLSHNLCFNCCAIFATNNNSEIECPECGYRPKPDIYRKIMTYGISAACYGHDYQEKYERQLAEKGEIKELYALLNPVTILSFLAVAALSGVVGGFSYDIVKSAFQNILKKAKKIQDDIGQTKIKFNNNTDIDIFIQQINSFHIDFKDINPIVKSAIKEEMLIGAIYDALKSKIEDDKFTKEDILKAFEKGIERVQHPQKLSKEDFIDFWKEIEGKDSN